MSQGRSFKDHSTLCYICNMMVAKPFVLKHMKSSFHINNVQIIDNILERSKEYIKVENKYETKSDAEYDEFCDVCSVSHSDVQKLNHKSSDQHKKLVVYTKILPKICILFKDFANNLNVIDEIKEILNEKELTLSKENSSEDKITSNASKEKCQNLKDSSDEIVLDNDEHDVKDTLTFEDTNVCMRTRKYKVHTKPNNLAEEIANINNEIFIQNTTETVNGLNKINPNESIVEKRPAHIIYCEICDIHVTFKRSNYTARNNTKQLNVPQQVSKSKKGKEKMSELSNRMDTHCKSPQHKKKVYEKVLTKTHYNTYIIDTLNNGVKQCKICKIVFDVNKTVEHVESAEHIDKYKQMLQYCNIIKVGDDYFCPTCDVFEHDVVEHVTEMHKTPFLYSYEMFCDVCRIRVPKSNVTLHNKGKLHIDNLKGRKEKPFIHINMYVEDIDRFKYFITVEKLGLKCKICNVLFYESALLMKHLKSYAHYRRFKKL